MNIIKAIKAVISSKTALDNRQGRFLTVYLDNGQRKNGKILVPGYFTSTVQLAYGPVIKLKNSSIRLVSTDHAIIKLR